MQAKITKQLLEQLTPRERPYEVCDTELAGFIVRVQPSGVKTFLCSYRLRQSGARDRMVLGRFPVLSPQQARDEAKKLLADVVRGVNPKTALAEARKARKQHTLRAFLSEVYEPWVQSHHADHKGTLARLRKAFASLLDTRLDDLTAWAVEKIRAERIKAGRKPSTVNRDLVVLKSALSKAEEWGHVGKHPLRKVKPARIDDIGRIRWLSPDEETRLYDALKAREATARDARASANAWRKERGYPELPVLSDELFVDHLQPMVLLSLNTGMRRGEVFQLRWTDVDLDRRQIKVRGATAKSRRTRYLPMTSEAHGTLSRWKKQQGAAELVFPGDVGRPFTNVKKAWQALLTAAKISSFRWHDMRHHFASRLVSKGVDLNTVRELLGHADIEMTLRYAHLAPEFKAQAIAKLERVA
jgi:integrase